MKGKNVMVTIKIGSTDITEYQTIAIDTGKIQHKIAANIIVDAYLREYKMRPKVVSYEEATERSYIIKTVERGQDSPAGEDGFIARTVNGQIELLCSYENALTRAVNEFIFTKFSIPEDAVYGENETLMTKEVSVVYYKDWSIIAGDGKTDDFNAIRQLHEYANAGGQKVVCESGKEYYLRLSGGNPIVIKTDVDFGDAKFIIDDTFMDISFECALERQSNIFRVDNDYDEIVFDENSELVKKINANGGIKSTDKTLPLDLGYDALIIPRNSENKMFHRWGGGKTGPGVDQNEVMVVYADNTIDKDTPVLFDFEKLTSLSVRRADTKPITFKGGKFITLAARYPKPTWPPFYYTYRTMIINRSNVTIDGLEHQVFEGEDKVFYQGFVQIRYANNVEVRNTKLSGRGGTGTYDISLNSSNNVRFIGCTQYNMFDENGRVYNEKVYWGIMGSNYCKNISYENCVLSRLDAHAGVYNFSIKNCEIAQINITGGGLGVIENCTVYNWRLIGLREDYGTFWRGLIRVKNVVMVQDEKLFTIFSGNYHDVYHGFKTRLPDLYVENVSFKNYAGEEIVPDCTAIHRVFVDDGMENGEGKINCIIPADYITIKQPESRRFTDIIKPVPYAKSAYTFKAAKEITYLPFEE